MSAVAAVPVSEYWREWEQRPLRMRLVIEQRGENFFTLFIETEGMVARALTCDEALGAAASVLLDGKRRLFFRTLDQDRAEGEASMAIARRAEIARHPEDRTLPEHCL